MEIKVRNETFDVIVRWIHLVALATGVGGVGFAVLVLFPSMPVLPADQQGAMGGAVFGRFGPIAWTVMGTATITGILLLVNRWPFSLRSTFAKVLIIKLVGVTTWALINAGVLLGLLPSTALQLSFVVGIVVFLLGATLGVVAKRVTAVAAGAT